MAISEERNESCPGKEIAFGKRRNQTYNTGI
jgi:hypothetical protein